MCLYATPHTALNCTLARQRRVSQHLGLEAVSNVCNLLVSITCCLIPAVMSCHWCALMNRKRKVRGLKGNRNSALKEVLFTMNAEVWNQCDASFDVKLFSPLVPLGCLRCHLVPNLAQTPPAGTKWHLVCADAKDELDIISRPCLPPIAQHIAPLGLISSGRACSETERAT